MNFFDGTAPAHVGFFSLDGIEAVAALLQEKGCPSEVIGSVAEEFYAADENRLYKAIAWALSQVVEK